MSNRFRFCPQCSSELQRQLHGEVERFGCALPGCGYVHWNNPVPVVAAVVQHEGKILLARNVAWPQKFFALITGFLEKDDPSPEQAVLREVEEELGLRAQSATFIGHYRFEQMNQLIIAYHVVAEGEVRLNEELAETIHVAPEEAKYWPAATGLALRDWLRSQGHEPQEIPLPSRRPRN